MKCVMNGQRNKALNYLKSGRPVIFATDTVNGIGCIYDNIECIEKIFRMKKRDEDKPLILLFDSMNRVKEYFELNNEEKGL
ncbi:MAG: Sua5/YciO/YrdC/YwlC family protein, partial [candidate division WOR-3 bacterium]|nr:Sua5/YciO/YrdC/YwlC family protein [candidate division WOR-3 bacterium]